MVASGDNVFKVKYRKFEVSNNVVNNDTNISSIILPRILKKIIFHKASSFIKKRHLYELNRRT